jgi:hypothetical protein
MELDSDFDQEPWALAFDRDAWSTSMAYRLQVDLDACVEYHVPLTEIQDFLTSASLSAR